MLLHLPLCAHPLPHPCPSDYHNPWFPGLSCTEENPCKRPDTNPLWDEHVTFIRVGGHLVFRCRWLAARRAVNAAALPFGGLATLSLSATADMLHTALLPAPLQGLPTDEAILDRVRALLKQWNATTVMVSEDSSHAYEHVRWGGVTGWGEGIRSRGLRKNEGFCWPNLFHLLARVAAEGSAQLPCEL